MALMHARMRTLIWTAGAIIGGSADVHADNFIGAHYDARTDELVIKMRYRGTNPRHTFTVQWGQCQPADDAGLKQISATLLDDQWSDVASMPFTKTTRLSLADVSCRPAEVTLHTAPRFYYTVNIPSAPITPRN
jgi:hypothetical protein